MKKIALLLGLGFTLSLVSCSSKTQTPDNDNTGNNNDNTDLPDNPGGEGDDTQDEPEIKEDSVELIYNLLVNTSYKAEVNESNAASFSNVAEDSNKTITTTEDVHILNNNSTIYYGTYDAKYNETPEFDETDTFIRKSEVKDYDGTKVYYDVTDYDKDNSKDDASRLPIVSNGSNDEDGISYLLESSVAGQLTKQSSLYVAQFIDANLLNNIDLGGLIPKVYYVENEDKSTSFYLHDFSYSYDDEGIETEISISFDVVLDSSYKLLTASTIFEQTETQGEADSYFYKEANSYSVSYGEKEATTSKDDINVEDYFITQVQSIRAYVLDGGNKIYYPLNGLPTNKYIRFEAESYLPSKAVDTSMIILSTKRDEVIIDDETAYAENPISTLLTFESVTGVFFSQDVTFVKPSIEEIDFSCNDLKMEKEYNEDQTELIYYVYNDTTYEDVFISVSPSGFNEEELVITYEDEGLLTLSKVAKYDSSIRYTLTVNDNPNKITETSITISSKENPSVKKIVNFVIKEKSDMSQLESFMISHEYSYTNPYTYLTYKIDFTSATEGIYYDNLGEDGITEIPFTYTLNDDYTLNIQFSKETYYLYSETDITISMDGRDIALNVMDGGLATHHYKAIEE